MNDTLPRSEEQFADVSTGLRLCFDTFGDPGDPPVVLVMGIATQMIAWHEDFCAALAAGGRYVVRFDNRDVGRSDRVDAAPPGGMGRMLTGRGAAYTLVEMARDAVGLLDHLDVGTAHVVGISMGGMIAQELAIGWPQRLRSMTSIASTPGMYHRGRPTRLSLRHPPRPAAVRALLDKAPIDREAYVERAIRATRALQSAETDRDLQDTIEVAGKAFDRGISRAGFARQYVAVTASDDRLPRLRQVRVPTLVLHGSRDPIIPLGHGRATARAIPGARLVVAPGMGHGLPRSRWPELLAAIGARIDDVERSGELA